MANRYMNQFQYSLVPSKCVLFGQVAIGGTGAPTISAANSKGIASIVRNSAGNYTVTLSDSWVKLLNIQAQFIDSGTQTVATTYVVSQTINSSAGKVIVIQCVDFAGAAVDPRSGATMLLEINLSNSTAQ
jgi:hypothetical protein